MSSNGAMTERVLTCGCAAVVDDGEVHVYPCGPGHYDEALVLARELADDHDIVGEVVL